MQSPCKRGLSHMPSCHFLLPAQGPQHHSDSCWSLLPGASLTTASSSLYCSAHAVTCLSAGMLYLWSYWGPSLRPVMLTRLPQDVKHAEVQDTSKETTCWWHSDSAVAKPLQVSGPSYCMLHLKLWGVEWLSIKLSMPRLHCRRRSLRCFGSSSTKRSSHDSGS